MEKSVYDFETLEDVIIFFCDERDIQPSEIEIGEAFGGLNPTEDDDPVFIWAGD